jgi:defect-in-organelle-trafficking protein DotB
MPEHLIYAHEPPIRWSVPDFNELLRWSTHSGMSDLDLCSGSRAWMRLDGLWRAVTDRPITTDELMAALDRMTHNNSASAMIKANAQDYDFLHLIEEGRGKRLRYRGNATPVSDGYSTGVKLIFRAIPSDVPCIADQNVEQEILDAAFPENGLVLVTGVMGSGKSTLLAGILREIIERGGRNVATYENPIEFDLCSIPNPGGPVSQSSIPEHFSDFLRATRNSTRTAPNVILIGEARDPETMRGMIESAEIGVAAYSTLHTRSVPEALPRIVNVFPYEEQRRIASTLISGLRLVISQRLYPHPSGKGRTALREHLVITPDIREQLLMTAPERLLAKAEELLLAHGKTMQQAAQEAYDAGLIPRENYLAVMAERLGVKTAMLHPAQLDGRQMGLFRKFMEFVEMLKKA